MKIIATLAASVAALCAMPASADTWPSQAVRIVVPYSAGGSYDAIARELAQHFNTTFNQSFIVENRPGAGGSVGTTHVARSKSDGYTLLFSGNASFANNELLYKNIPYSGETDFTPISMISLAPMIVAAHADVKGETLAEIFKQAGSKELTFGSPGNGTIGHLTGESISDVSGQKLMHIPYKGDSAVLSDLMGGTIQLGIGPAVSYMGPAETQRIKIVAVASSDRLDALPDVPTAKEQGINLESSAWMALASPAGVDPGIVSKINAATNDWLNSDAAKKRLNDLVQTPMPGPPEALSQAITDEKSKWTPIVKRLNIQLD